MYRSHSRPKSPVDADLQQLYNEVWAGFANEASTTVAADQELEGVYGTYGGDARPPTSPGIASPVSPNSSQYSSKTGLPSAPNMPAQSKTSSKSSAFRRLPPTPEYPSSTASPTNSIAMPEPDVYHDSANNRPNHYSADSYTSNSSSTDLLRKATGGSAIGRRLPPPPAASNSTFSSNGSKHPLPGLPADVRLHHNISPQSYIVDSPVQGPFPNDFSFRPPGALPPADLSHFDRSHNSSLDHRSPSFNIYYDVDSRNGTNGYYQAQQRQLQHQQSQNYPNSLDVPAESTHRASQENLAEPSAHASYPFLYADSPGLQATFGGYTNAQLTRSVSGSSQSGFLNPEPSILSQHSSHREQFPGHSENVMFINENSSYIDDNHPVQRDYFNGVENVPSNIVRRPTSMLLSLAKYGEEIPEFKDEEQDVEYWEDDDEEDENRFVNFSLLSHIAVQLRDKVPRGTHVKGSIPYPRAFTGKDIVSTIQSQIQRELAINHGISTSDRRVALQVARSLQSQLFFYEVEWGGGILQDGVEDVYMFLDDQEGGSDTVFEQTELPTGVVTMLTRCYSPSCGDGAPCYIFSCPRKGKSMFNSLNSATEAPVEEKKEEWTELVDPSVLRSLPESEINRQSIIHKIISKEKQYLQDLDIVESVFIKPLRLANPPVLPPEHLEDFIDDVFGNILDLRECNRRLLEVMYVRQREQAPIIQRIGDIFLDAATEFRLAYPAYIGHYPISEKRMKDELDTNPEFRLFLEHCSRQSARPGESVRLDLKHFLNRPSEHLQKYPVLLEAVQSETAVENPDADFLLEASEAIKNLQSVAQLRTFQSAMGKGTAGKWEWHDLVAPDVRAALPKTEAKRQSIIFELIKGEMAYVKDLENITAMYINPLRMAQPPIIPPDRLNSFIQDVFHNYLDLHAHHLKLVQKFHEIQLEQHPTIRSVTAALLDAALHFRDAYMEYIPNYPIAAYRIDDEMATNLAFKTFVDQCIRHADAHRLDMKNFINRPIPRLLRYELLLKGIREETPAGHEDIDAIPQVIDIIKALGKETEPGVFSAKQKVELWRYNSYLVFKPGETIDMDLLNQHRSMLHSGKLLRQPDSGLEWNGWSELFVLLFDNYLVMTKPKERDDVVKYHVNRRPIPLDLLSLVNATDPPTQRSTGLLRNLRGGERHGEPSGPNTAGNTPEGTIDSRAVYPITVHYNGRMGGPYILYAESAQARAEWKAKLEEALGMRKIVQESNKVFEVETLSADTFLVPPLVTGGPAWNQEATYTGKVTCSVPFNTLDGRALVAVGCAEGVWIGLRHDPKSMRRVLHLKQVTQCAMLDEFGIFLVLADKSLFAYHIEALVPSSPQGAHTSQVPQKLNGTKDVHFFSVGTLRGRTLIVYMKRKGLDSIFRALEPVGDKINEKVKAPAGLGSRFGFRSAKSEWFRIYRDFFLPSESYDLIFFKARIAILCAKGFEFMDLNDFNSVTIPLREELRQTHPALAKRCEACRPLGILPTTDGFLLCYDEFGLYADKHGDPCRSPETVEWEGTPERIAHHHPYIILFDPRFIEIRDIETGRLAQIIIGNDVRCIWDGRGVNSQTAITPNGQETILPEPQIHAVMNITDSSTIAGSRNRAIAQHVFELVPTVPLYPPDLVNSGNPYQPSSPSDSRMSWRS